MTKVLLTRENNHLLLHGILPFITMAAGIYMASNTSTRPLFSIAFIGFAGFSFIAGLLFWRTRNIIMEKDGNLVFQGFFSRLILPAKKVIGMQTEGQAFGRYKLLVKTEEAVYSLFIPEPNRLEWKHLSAHLEKGTPFPYHLN